MLILYSTFTLMNKNRGQKQFKLVDDPLKPLNATCANMHQVLMLTDKYASKRVNMKMQRFRDTHASWRTNYLAYRSLPWA